MIYGLIIGLLHFTTLLGCSSAQIQHISQSPLLKNATASDYFYGFDIIYIPIVTGVLTLIIGLVFGVIFAFAYRRLPGSKSSRKGVSLGFFTFFFVLFVGPGYFTEYYCSGSVIPNFPYFTFALSFPAAIIFGFLLGSFYDSFGRLEAEETEERKKVREQEHWSDYFRRNPRRSEESRGEDPGDGSGSTGNG